MRCLVLGGRGFIGSRVVTRLLEKKWKVTVFARKKGAVAPAFPADVTLIEGDFLSEKSLADALNGCDVCVHAITSTSPQSANEDPLYDVQSNLLPTINLLRLISESSVKKLIFISSGGAYGNPRYSPIDESHPTNPIGSYGITKLAIEHYLAMYDSLNQLNYKILRVANPFGPGQKIDSQQGAVGIFMAKILRDEPVTIWGDGSAVRDYLYVDDVASAIVAAVEYDGPVKTFNIGSGSGQSLIDTVRSIERVTHKRATINFEPLRSFDVVANILDVSLARRELDWEPQTSFHDGLKKMAVWLSVQLNRH
jgi:UDP-glucose 4-epimerase